MRSNKPTTGLSPSIWPTVALYRLGNRPPDLLVCELLERYWTYAKAEYGEGPGTPTNHMKPALREFRKLYGQCPAAEFGPRKLKGVPREPDETGT